MILTIDFWIQQNGNNIVRMLVKMKLWNLYTIASENKYDFFIFYSLVNLIVTFKWKNK